MHTSRLGLLLLWCAFLAEDAYGQHLWWDLEGEHEATCLYGEIVVLATEPHIYYCGANWHPGEPAGGYCGIQHNGPRERRTIFSIWDTSPVLHPSVTAADPKTIFNRFGGEGEGAHTHMIWDWKEREPFRFFVHKVPGAEPGTIDARYFVLDPGQKHWTHSATITSPQGGKKSVATFGGGLNSFLENFTGRGKQVPKLALYRLWLGRSPETLRCLTRARGDGTWGVLNDAYYLAEGDPAALSALFTRLEPRLGKHRPGGRDTELPPLSEVHLAAPLVRELRRLAAFEPVRP
ncbi:MAG: DUF3472 domain-containing protein [Isosphaeraceae bacterium]